MASYATLIGINVHCNACEKKFPVGKKQQTLRKWSGFWAPIQVPALLAGKEVTLQSAMAEKLDIPTESVSES